MQKVKDWFKSQNKVVRVGVVFAAVFVALVLVGVVVG